MVKFTAEDLVSLMAWCAVIAVLFVILMNRRSGKAPVKEVAPSVGATPALEVAASPHPNIDQRSSPISTTTIQSSTWPPEPTEALRAAGTADGPRPFSDPASRSQPLVTAPTNRPRPFKGPTSQLRPPAVARESNPTIPAGYAAPAPVPVRAPKFESPPRRPLFGLEPDYARNTGRAGFLYVARNNSHRPGVYKLGQTTLEPQERINALNRQLAEAGDLGEFHLVHASAVRDAYGQEQQLFEALQERRIAEGREYFFADALVLREATEAVALAPHDAGAALRAFRGSKEWVNATPRPTPSLPVCVVPARLGKHGGWIYVMQNFWHEAGTAILSVTKKTESAILAEINEAQRTLTSQLGFYQVVACAAVPSTQAGLAAAKRLFEPYRLPHRRRFVRADLRTFKELIERARAEAGEAQAPPFTAATAPRPPKESTVLQAHSERSPVDPTAEIKVTVLTGPALRSFAPWTAQCRGCGSRLRFMGVIGASAKVKCPVDGCASPARLIRLGASRVEILD